LGEPEEGWRRLNARADSAEIVQSGCQKTAESEWVEWKRQRGLRVAQRVLIQALRRDLQWDVQMGGLSTWPEGPSFSSRSPQP